MYKFFEYNPDNVEVIPLPVKDPREISENGTPKVYFKAMEDEFFGKKIW